MVQSNRVDLRIMGIPYFPNLQSWSLHMICSSRHAQNINFCGVKVGLTPFTENTVRVF